MTRLNPWIFKLEEGMSLCYSNFNLLEEDLSILLFKLIFEIDLLKVHMLYQHRVNYIFAPKVQPKTFFYLLMT